MSCLRVFESKTKKNSWSHERRRLENKNKEREAILQVTDTEKCIKSLSLKWYILKG
jgi:hypothetical protein